MGAPKGNEFWKLRSKHGRDKLFKTPELLWEAACEYFHWCNEHPWLKMEQNKGRTSMKVDLKNDGVDFDTIQPNTLVALPTARPYTLSGLCLYLNCNQAYFRQFRSLINDKKEEKLTQLDKDFSTVITRIEETIYTQKYEGAVVGAYNPNIIARDLGLVDKKDMTSGDKPIKTSLNITVDSSETAELLKKLRDGIPEAD